MLATVARILRLALSACAAAIVLFSFAWVLSRPFRTAGLKAGQTRLTVLHWGDKTEDGIDRKLIEAFETQNPDIKVVRTNVGSPAQLQTKLQTMLASGDPPDLFYLDFQKVAAFASQNVLEGIEPFLARDRAAGAADTPDLVDFFPATLDAFRYDPATRGVGRGDLVGLPKDFTCVGFYYNRSLFDRAGVRYPPETGWTWDEFIAAARKIAKLPDCYGAEVVTWESMVRIFLYSHGLDLAEPGFQKFRLTEPDVVATLDKLRSWFHDEDRTLLSAKTQLETGQAPFLTGKIGMAGPFGRWQVPLYRLIPKEKFDWDFAPLPHAAGKSPSNGVLTVAWAMARDGRHKEQSWRLMKFLLSRQGQEMVCNTGLAIPVLQSVANSPCFTDPAAKPENDDVFLSGAIVAKPIEWPADTRFMDELKTCFENIFKLGRPTQPELAKVQVTLEKLAEFRAAAPPVPWRPIATVAAIVMALFLAPGVAYWFMRRPGKLEAAE